MNESVRYMLILFAGDMEVNNHVPFNSCTVICLVALKAHSSPKSGMCLKENTCPFIYSIPQPRCSPADKNVRLLIGQKIAEKTAMCSNPRDLGWAQAADLRIEII